MDRSQRPRSNVERRSRSNPNVFADGFAAEVEDARRGHRISQPIIRRPEEWEPLSRTDKRARTPSFVAPSMFLMNKHGERMQHEGSSRRSIAKERRSSFGILNGGSTVESRPSSLYADAQTSISVRNRPTSNASSYAPYENDRSDSPVLGSSGPSHAYDMFPQAGVARSSVAVPSALRLQPSLHTPAHPAHPYGLYQQNTLPVGEDEEISPLEPAIPIGLPGRSTNFHRHIGPDGEEQYILGPDGHTEQLPPYSKYPDQSSEKIGFAAAGAPMASSSPQPQPQQPFPQDWPLQAPSHQSPTRSLEDVISPAIISEPETTPSLLERRPTSDMPTPESSRSSVISKQDEKKPWKEKSWKERRRTRVCAGRIPVWALLTFATCVLFLVIILGGVIGGLLTAEKGEKEPPTVTVTNTQSMFDASLIPTPTGMPPLPTGRFYLPLGVPQEQQKNCLISADQFNAWSCNVPPAPMIVDVRQPGFSIMKMWGVGPPTAADGKRPRFNYTYGAQPPRIQPMQRLYWVSDIEEPARGPALHFQTNYDKLVILDPSQFSTARKRSAYGYGNTEPPSSPPGRLRHRFELLTTGDQPWFCYWNQTSIEGFVYMQQNSSTHGGTPPSVISGGLLPSSSTAEPSVAQATSSLPAAAAAAAGSPARKDELRLAPTKVKRAADSVSYSSTGSSLPSASSPFAGFDRLPGFPFIMKIVERRVPNSATAVQPYCIKMVVPPDGDPVPMNDDDGNPIKFNLLENDPSPSNTSTASTSRKHGAATRTMTATASATRPKGEEVAQLRRLLERSDPPKSCHCLWVSPNRP
ncbi:hypothetical protein EJ08DRAFT_700461 [Tothia fuscella]|uniref:DUF7820 domain-containing protein n=1 Tax=Tothia fuscella TaxID=1048955 RepID=A0A9P4TUI0_9PEZI|nr:hypothetical protein EJ08DRAFT_700461 [Tothia fuscella]